MWNEGLFWGWKLPPWIRCVTPKLTSQTHLVYLQGVVSSKSEKLPNIYLISDWKRGLHLHWSIFTANIQPITCTFHHKSPRWFQAIQVWRWRVSPRRESLNGIRELWFKCDSVRMMMFWCYGRCGCQWEVLGIPVYPCFILLMGGAWNAMDFQTKYLGVETGKSFPCVQALADRRALMTKLEHRNFHGRHCEHTKLLVPGGSWIRVEHNTFWIALFCFPLPDFVSESLVSIERRPSTHNAWSKALTFRRNIWPCAPVLCSSFTFAESEHRLGKGSRVLLSRAHLQFESSRFEVVQLITVYKKAQSWLSTQILL